MLVVNSTLNSAIYMYSLPDLKLIGSADVGVAPDWLTLTPDNKAYVANSGMNTVSVIDLATRKEITRIPVGEVPKRNITADSRKPALASPDRPHQFRPTESRSLGIAGAECTGPLEMNDGPSVPNSKSSC